MHKLRLTLINFNFPLSATLLTLVLGWEYATTTDPELGFLLGKPSEIIKAIPNLFSSETVRSFLWTLSTAIGGLAIGTLFGTFLALTAALWKTMARVSIPCMSYAASLPLLALAPIFTFWCGIDWPAKVCIAAFATTFLAYEQALYGSRLALESLPNSLQQVTSFRKLQLLRYVLIPGAGTQIHRGIRINSSTAVTGVILAEFVSSEHGLGHLLLQAMSLYRLNEAWLVLILIAITYQLLNTLYRSGQRIIERAHYSA